MTTKRVLFGVFWAAVVGVPAFAQAPLPTTSGSGVPTPAPLSSSGSGLPYMSTPLTPAPGPTAVLTAPPGAAVAGQPLPPGSVASPWCGGSPTGAGCCGPVGANGPVTYELYVRTGPNLIAGGSTALSGSLGSGWVVAGGGRTLLFDTTGDAAWALDLGVGYNYTRGESRVIDVFSPRETDPNTGQLAGPDQIHPFRIRGLYRSWFNYAVGRDWFLNGPGFLGGEQAGNTRLGFDVGGRWGYGHVDLVPVADPRNYLRRSGVTHGLFLGTNYTWERPMGAWILVVGARAEWGITFMNLIPPQNGNLQDVNLLLTVGVRF